jgi:serine/threonine protein kinase
MVVKRFKLGQVHVLLLLRQTQKMMAMGLSASQEVGVSIEGTAASMVMEWMVGDLGNIMDLSLMPSKWDSALNNFYDMYVMLSIARGMKKFHTSGLLHQEVKASNILLWRVSVKITHKDIVWLPMLSQHLLNVSLKIGEYERCEGVTDIYSFTMVCSEILTGCTPSQGHHLSDYDLVLSGKTPSFLHI